jgi:hypothetical protein
VVDRDRRGFDQDRRPAAVGEPEREAHEDAEVQLAHAAPDLDLQRR